MAFVDNVSRGAMLIILNGEDSKGAPLTPCPKCRRPLMRVFVTARVRQLDPSLPPWQDVCITKNWLGPIPCPRALEAAGLIDRLMEVSRR